MKQLSKSVERLLPWQRLPIWALVLMWSLALVATFSSESFAQEIKASANVTSASAASDPSNKNSESSRSSEGSTKVTNARNAKAVSSAAGRELTIERSFSISYIKVPTQCELSSFKTICTRLVNYYARRFEREMVSLLNYDNGRNVKDMFVQSGQRSRGGSGARGGANNRAKSIQHVSMSIYSPPEAPVMTLFSVFNQQITGEEKSHLLVETINFEVETGKSLKFEQLFENADLAAMLCARAIEAKYSKYKSPLLQVVVSATELSPSNFIVTSQGLRFFFAPNLVKPNTTVADSMLVSLKKLQDAKPILKWWDRKADPQRSVKDREALAKSSLRNVIRLEEDTEQDDAATTTTISSSSSISSAGAGGSASAGNGASNQNSRVAKPKQK